MNWDSNQFTKEDIIEISLLKGIIVNKSKQIKLNFEKIPKFLMDMLECGGALNQLKNTL